MLKIKHRKFCANSSRRLAPDYVVGLTRGGLVPANLISQYLGCRMETLKVSLRDDANSESESNLWMAEDAYGHKITIHVFRRW
jgi:hypoxanthine phosphoribosyltransferase